MKPQSAPPYSVLVNSCDAYSDCWDPFFRLFALHWSDCTAPVFLNTERADWTCPYRPVTCTRLDAGRQGPRRSWAEHLDTALQRLNTPLVLYLQEDYFFHAPVQAQVIDALAGTMIADPTIGHIGLTHFGSGPPFTSTADPRLWRIDQRARYRISTQAGLWRTEVLRSYLRAGESGWMFEILGSLIARRRDDLLLTVNRDLYGPGKRVIDYLHTGIIKGRWHRQQPAIFKQFGIEVDFARRGFYTERHWLLRRFETFRSLARSPGDLWRLGQEWLTPRAS